MDPIELSLLERPRLIETSVNDRFILNNLSLSDVEKLIDECDKDDLISEYFQQALSFLLKFVQQNFTGPIVENAPENSSYVLDQLTVDGETPFSGFHCLNELLWAKWILSDCRPKFKDLYPSVDIWAVRCLFLLQKCLEIKSNTLKTAIFGHLINCEKFIENQSSSIDLDLKAVLFSEWSYCYLYYYDLKSAKRCMQLAENYANLSVSLTGVLGKKTKFQQHDVAQLVTEVKKMTPNGSITEAQNEKCLSDSNHICPKIQNMPLDCNLDNDTLLDQTKFFQNFVNQSLTPNQQCVVLAVYNLRRRGKAIDILNDEESLAYLQALLNHPQNWCVQRAALIARCRAEMRFTRRLERCLKQLEQLVNEVRSPELVETATFELRLPLFFGCDLMANRRVEKLLADVLLKAGAVRAALDVYERLELWNETVECYRTMKMLDRAEALIRRRLKERETPLLFCALGDVTGDPALYEKAWQISGARYAPAQESLGKLFCSQKKYAEAIDALQKATNLQPLLHKSWFMLGHCAAAIERYEVAAKAYHRCVNLDDDNFEGWNNLAAVYVNMGEKERAFLILQEAIRCSYDNWKLWDNFTLISVEIGRYEETIRGLHRLMDLKEKYYDLRVLSILVEAAISLVSNENETIAQNGKGSHLNHPPEWLIAELRKYFGRLTAAVSSDAQIWCLYAELAQLDDSTDSLAAAARHAQKAFACSTQKPDWALRLDSARRATSYALKYAQIQEKLISVTNENDQKERLRNATRFTLKQVLSALKKYHCVDDGESGKENINDLLKEDFEKLKELLS